jgi:hypothetical protein
MESWGVLLFMAVIITTVILCIRHQKKTRERIDRAFTVGRLQGHYEGWLTHANGTPLDAMPPRLQEIEEVTGIQQGWGSGFYDYPDTDELVQSLTLGKVTWAEWQAKKLKALNEKYLISDQKEATAKE